MARQKTAYNKKMYKTCLECNEVQKKHRIHSNSSVSLQRERFSSEFLIEHGWKGTRYTERLMGVAKHEWEISLKHDEFNGWSGLK